MSNLLPNAQELRYSIVIALILTATFFWLERSFKQQHDNLMDFAEQCAEYSGINEDNSAQRMETYYACLEGE